MSNERRLPPGPSGLFHTLPLLPKMRDNLLTFFDGLRAEHGDAVYYSLGGTHVYQFNHPDMATEVLATKHHAFLKPKLLKQVLGQWNGNGLVVNEGESWVKQRRLVNPAFKPQRIAEHIGTVVERVDKMIDGWTQGSEYDVARDLGRLTLGFTAEALFGAEVEHLTDAFLDHVAILNEAATRELSMPFFLPEWSPTPNKAKIRRVTAFLRNTVDNIIAERRKNKAERNDLLALLLSVRDEEGDGSSMSDVQARDESINLLLGGNETTATGLTWTLHLLAQHPEIQEEIRSEADHILGGKAPSTDTLSQLKLSEMAFKESMRLYPPAYVLPRQAIEDVDIGGYFVSKNALVQVFSYGIQRDARWFEEPLSFRPRRFEQEQSFQRGSYIPFGAGPRACIGRGFALMEGAVVISRLLSRVKFLPSRTAPPVEMEVQVSLHPKGGLPLLVEKR